MDPSNYITYADEDKKLSPEIEEVLGQDIVELCMNVTI